MNNTNNKEEFKRRVHSLQELDPSSFELWKFYEQRAERLGARLWDTGIWLMTILTATLASPFVVNFVVPTEKFPYLLVKVPFAIVLIAIIGMLFCFYAYAVLKDMREHIEKNWRKAGCILEDTWQADWSGRKGDGWNVLQIVLILSFTSFLSLLILAVLNANNTDLQATAPVTEQQTTYKRNRHTITLVLSQLSDLKVEEGQRINVGDIIRDRPYPLP